MIKAAAAAAAMMKMKIIMIGPAIHTAPQRLCLDSKPWRCRTINHQLHSLQDNQSFIIHHDRFWAHRSTVKSYAFSIRQPTRHTSSISSASSFLSWLVQLSHCTGSGIEVNAGGTIEQIRVLWHIIFIIMSQQRTRACHPKTKAIPFVGTRPGAGPL